MLKSGVAVLLLLVCALVGCTPVDHEADARSSAAVASLTPAASPLSTPAAAAGMDYVVQPFDVLDISVFQVPDLSKTVDVSSSGQIVLPLIGQIQASGKTVRALEQEITAKLQADYLQSPQVSIAVKEYTTQTVTVDGAVAKPGVYQVKGQMTLLQALATAGGIDRSVADPKGIVVLRRVDGKAQVAKFDYDAITIGQTQDPMLLAGDVVKVDRSGFRAAFKGLRETIPVFGLFTPLI